MRVLYAADVQPADTTSGARLIYRHLRLLAEHAEVWVAHWDECGVPGVRSLRLPMRSLAALALRSRRRRHFEALDGIMGFRISDRTLRRAIRRIRPDVLVTIAQGGLCQNARRAAAAEGLPLAAFFHDWWSDWRANPDWARRLIDRSFRRLYRCCSLPLCVSEPLRASLGAHPRAVVLPPIPQPGTFLSGEPLPPPAPAAPALYAGLLNGFCEEELRQLGGFALTREAGAVPLRFAGPNPWWGDPIGIKILREGIYAGFLQRDQLVSALASARFLLVVIPFNPASRRFAECSFPSKLTEYCAVGRPIAIWGPPASFAVKWAAQTQAALCVTDASPAALFQALENLALDEQRQRGLAERARREFREHFQPDRLQRRFETSLAALSSRRNP